MFVDVGGGMGYQPLMFKSLQPSLKRRIILQYLSAVLTTADPLECIELMPHNLWEEQPAHGTYNCCARCGIFQMILLAASFNYLRNILHDYPDVRRVTLL